MNVRVCARHTRKQVLAPQAEQAWNYHLLSKRKTHSHKSPKNQKQESVQTGTQIQNGRKPKLDEKPWRTQKQRLNSGTKAGYRNMPNKYMKSTRLKNSKIEWVKVTGWSNQDEVANLWEGKKWTWICVNRLRIQDTVCQTWYKGIKPRYLIHEIIIHSPCSNQVWLSPNTSQCSDVFALHLS